MDQTHPNQIENNFNRDKLFQVELDTDMKYVIEISAIEALFIHNSTTVLNIWEIIAILIDLDYLLGTKVVGEFVF